MGSCWYNSKSICFFDFIYGEKRCISCLCYAIEGISEEKLKFWDYCWIVEEFGVFVELELSG